MKNLKNLFLILIFLGSLLVVQTGCDGPGEKLFDEANVVKKEADQSEGDERVKLYLDAIDIMKKAIELEPENAEYYAKLAACYKNIERYDESIKAYNKSIEIDPDISKNYYKLMGVLTRSQKFDEAQALYDEAIELDVIKRDPKAKLHMDEQLGYLETDRANYEAQMARQADDVTTGTN